MSTLVERVLLAANEVPDPCSVAQRMPAGMTDMGLVTDVRATDSAAGARVEVTVRVTAPGRLYAPYFELELRRRLQDLPEIKELSITWSTASDWTEDDMVPQLRDALQARRQAAMQRLGVTFPTHAGERRETRGVLTIHPTGERDDDI